MKLLDIGCGCLRGGHHFVKYLNSANNFGVDLSQDLLDIGYEKELVPLGLQLKLPRENLYADGKFDMDHFGVVGDFGFHPFTWALVDCVLVAACTGHA